MLCWDFLLLLFVGDVEEDDCFGLSRCSLVGDFLSDEGGGLLAAREERDLSFRDGLEVEEVEGSGSGVEEAFLDLPVSLFNNI